jgi:hypothetical protein
MGLLGGIDSTSTANQKSQDVSGSGQLNERATVAQGGSVLLGKGAKLGLDLSKTKIAKGGTITINQGPSNDLLQSLIGNLPAPSAPPPPVVVSAPSSPPSTDTTNPEKLLDVLKKNPLIVGVLVLLSLFLLLKK